MAQEQTKPEERLELIPMQIQFIQDLLCGDGSPTEMHLSANGVEGLYFFLDDIKDAIRAVLDKQT